MIYNSNRHDRHSIRLKGYDYSRQGLYYITLCCQDRICLFGEIIDEKMILNDAGKIANECWNQIPEHFPNTILHEYIVMPNHIHGIIEIMETHDKQDLRRGEKFFVWTGEKSFAPTINANAPTINAQFNSPSKTIGSIIRGYKIGVTKWFRNNSEIYTVWQRNYYDIIIRNEQSYDFISDYIIHNPINWHKDNLYIMRNKE